MISISILCFNRWDVTKRCLESILVHTRDAKTEIEILVLDNGSTDRTPRELANWAHVDRRVRVLTEPENRGVILAKARTFRESRGDIFVSLDNDCWVGPRWLELLTAPINRRPSAGLPIIAQVGRSGAFGTLGHTGIGHHGGRLDYIDGSCFAVRKDAAIQVGGVVDTAFDFAYCEDPDLSLRLRKAGWLIAVVNTPVHHQEHQTAHHSGPVLGKRLKEAAEKNHRLLLKRWGGYVKTGHFGHPGEPAVSQRKEGEGDRCKINDCLT